MQRTDRVIACSWVIAALLQNAQGRNESMISGPGITVLKIVQQLSVFRTVGSTLQGSMGARIFEGSAPCMAYHGKVYPPTAEQRKLQKSRTLCLLKEIDCSQQPFRDTSASPHECFYAIFSRSLLLSHPS